MLLNKSKSIMFSKPFKFVNNICCQIYLFIVSRIFFLCFYDNLVVNSKVLFDICIYLHVQQYKYQNMLYLQIRHQQISQLSVFIQYYITQYNMQFSQLLLIYIVVLQCCKRYQLVLYLFCYSTICDQYKNVFLKKLKNLLNILKCSDYKFLLDQPNCQSKTQLQNVIFKTFINCCQYRLFFFSNQQMYFFQLQMLKKGSSGSGACRFCRLFFLYFNYRQQQQINFICIYSF
eukprot:TRINITY_DN5991_c1_g1_i10.p2 TRINITY_DN5991_c1_g1~~TRINITY_DN5991_c1_g1_i10.p2  ORF type:complete len:231 (-),score=-31.88 TRINITY_DN5991_c1_g1_i10:210-902(-)